MSTEFVGIELQLMGADGVRRDLQDLDRLLHSLGGKKKFDMGLNEARAQVVAFRGEVEKLQREQSKFEKNSDEWKSYASKIDEAKQKLWNAQQAVREFGQASREAGKTFMQTFNAISSKVAHVGSAMQSMGNALTRLGSFMRPITTGLLMGAGYKAFNLLTEGFGGAFERADIMKNYPRTISKLFKDDADAINKAETAVKDMEQAVLGLPTGLDEIIAVQKRFVSASQDMEKSTGLAIAFNNAILASGADARQAYTAQRLFTQLAGGAELTTTQWQALQKAIPLAFTELANQAEMSVGDYVKAVSSGTIATEDFLNTFTEAGSTGTIADMARVMTKSWQGLTANITNATKRMGTAILDSLHEAFKSQTGRDLLDTLLGIDANGERTYDGIRDWIDSISKSVQNWIKANPDRIIEFFNNLKAIDFKGLLKGMAQGMGDILTILEALSKIAADKDMTSVGRFLAKSGFYGRALTIFGGLLKGLRHPIAAIGAAGSWLFKGKLGRIGIFGKIASLFGKKKDIEEVGEIGKAVTTASPKLLSAFKNMALISGIVSMPAFTAWGVTAAVKNSIKNFKETINLLKDMDWGSAAKLASGIAVFLGASAGLGAVVGKFGVGASVDIAIGETIVGIIMTIATGFADLNMALIKGSIKKFVESVKLLGEIPDVSSFGDVKNKISNAITMLNEISTLFQGRYVDKGVKEGGIQGAGLFTSFSINSITKSLTGLKKAVKAVQDLANVSIPEGAADNIKRAVDAVSEASSNMWKLWGLGYGSVKNNTENIIESLTNLKKIIKQINGLKGVKVKKDGITAVKNAITNIGNAFDATAIGDIRVKITAFVASIQDAFTMFDKLNKTITIKTKVKLSKDFESSVDEVVRQINSARGRIRRAWNNIPDSLSKTITLTVNGKVNASGALNGISKGIGSNISKLVDEGVNKLNTPAMGGPIYRAHGGGVPFKRRGTDTVPAMLTPGEYVHNKRAVSAFGIDFMRKVNNLDMKGAMNELMHRAGHMANINRGATITNNNYNNQKVVINNSNAGAGYTFKTASRFVGAF